jgi:hypothetical protein
VVLVDKTTDCYVPPVLNKLQGKKITVYNQIRGIMFRLLSNGMTRNN